MSPEAQAVLEAALALSSDEQAIVVNVLLSSLHKSDPEIDLLWQQEVEDRLSAYDAGETKAIPASEVFKELRNL